MAAPPRWKRRPEGSNWGDFGPNDQLGRLNLITSQKVREGLIEAREGLTFCLGLPLDYPGGNLLSPRRHPPVLRPTLQGGRPFFNYPLAGDNSHLRDVVSDDLAILYLQYSTQWDSLAHVGQMFDADGDGVPEPVFYNGYRAGMDIRGPTEAHEAGVGLCEPYATCRADALGIERMAEHGVQGRGVMVNLRAHLGDARTVVGYEQLMRILQADRVEVEPGDIVCLHTGFAQLVLDMKGIPDVGRLHRACATLDGDDSRLLQWITDSGLAAIAADNQAVEDFPRKSGEACCLALPLHAHCLFKLGIPLGELWHLTPLAAWLRTQHRSRFLLTAPPLRLPGAVGSPVTPIATV